MTYYDEGPVVYWGNKTNNFMYTVVNTYSGASKTVYSIVSTDFIYSYNGKINHGAYMGMYLKDNTSGFGLVGVMREAHNVDSWGGYAEILHPTLNNDVRSYDGKWGMISTSKKLDIRWSSKEGIDIDNMIRKYRAPIYVMEDINKLKEKRQNLIS